MLRSLVGSEMCIRDSTRWIKRPESQKHKKFGKEMLEKARDLALGCMGNIKDLAPDELRKKLHQYSSIEKKYPHQGPGKETSKEDKQILALAQKNQANIATLDKPLTALAPRVVGEGRVYDFTDMVIDLFKKGKLTKEEVKDGLHNLAYYDDKLSSKDTAKIIKACLLYTSPSPRDS